MVSAVRGIYLDHIKFTMIIGEGGKRGMMKEKRG